jgi:hypothetical protein
LPVESAIEPQPEAAAVWSSLAQELRDRHEVWASHAEEMGVPDLQDLANAFLRLIPLVEAMQSHPVPCALYPFLSHEWLRLSTLPPATTGGRISEIWAAATGEERFVVRRLLRHRLPEWHFKELAEGPAEEMARLIASEIARELGDWREGASP